MRWWLVFCFCASVPVQGQSEFLSRLERDQRYADLLQISLLRLADANCRSATCQAGWSRNVARASLLLGDYENARYYLKSSTDKAGVKLRAYVSLLQRDEPGLMSYQANLSDNSLAGRQWQALVGSFGEQRNDPESVERVRTVISKERKDLAGAYRDPPYSATRAAWFSAIIPGSGHAYLGMWSSAAVSLLLVGVCGLATHELAEDQNYGAATAAGLIGSVFYAGGILSAAKSAHALNDRSYVEVRSKIRQWALPELRFEWSIR